MSAPEDPELSVTAPGGASARARGYRSIDLIVIGLAVLVGWTYYQQDSRLDDHGARIIVALDEITGAQREMSCLLSLPMEERERQYMDPESFCRRMGRARILVTQPTRPDTLRGTPSGP